MVNHECIVVSSDCQRICFFKYEIRALNVVFGEWFPSLMCLELFASGIVKIIAIYLKGAM